MKKSGANILVECLANQGTKKIFGVPGESYLSVINALIDYSSQIQWIGARQEGGASFMAAAYAQLTGKTGICFVTRAPGATNASIGIHTAFQGSIPMILFIGQVSSNISGREAFQELDYKEMYSGMAKWVYEIQDVDRIPEILSRAFNIANNGRPGPVVISLPEDILSLLSDANPSSKINIIEPSLSEEVVLNIKEKLLKSKKPVFIVGGTCWNREGIAQLNSFIENNNFPVISSFRRQDIFNNHSSSYAGVCSFINTPKLNDALNEADLIFAFNTLLGDITTSNYSLWLNQIERRVVIQSHASLLEIGKVYQVDLAINSGPNYLALKLNNLGKIGDWSSHTSLLRSNYIKGLEIKDQPGQVDMGKIINYLQDKLPEDVILTNGAGNFSTWSNLLFKFGKKARLLAPTSGAMGFGLPAAITAKITNPNRTVICFAGDGDFQMNMAELGTALHYKAFPIILLLNNSSYGTIRMHQEKSYPDRVYATDIENPDYSMIAKAYGIPSYQVNKTEEFQKSFDKVIKSEKGAIIEIILDIQSISPHKTLNEIKMKTCNSV